MQSRAPRGARGLKFRGDFIVRATVMSRPARGAWIEIRCGRRHHMIKTVAPREGRVD